MSNDTTDQTNRPERSRTTISLSTTVRDALFERKRPTESYDDVLRRELDDVPDREPIPARKHTG